jgi:large subunit ribosomal protein L13
MKTFSAKAADVKRAWWVIDAADQHLGHVAVKAANLLRGKGKAIYTAHVDTGDFVVVINADKVALTGKKREQKFAYHHSGYPGGLSAKSYTELMVERPDRAVEKAVRGMLPHTTLGRAMIKKLKVYSGPNHPHAAQQPVPFEITQVAQ